MIILGGLIKKAGGKGISKVPFLGDIPVLGEALFTHTSDVEREQNVVIYLTPYIVRRSGDLEKLKEMLAELEEVQIRYNRLVEHALEKNKGKRHSNSSSSEAFTEAPEDVPAPLDPTHTTVGTTSNLDLLKQPEEEF